MTRWCVLTPWKTPHPSRGDAQRAADEMNARTRGKQVTTVYKCRCGCAQWFPTHKGRTTRAQRWAKRRAQRHSRP